MFNVNYRRKKDRNGRRHAAVFVGLNFRHWEIWSFLLIGRD